MFVSACKENKNMHIWFAKQENSSKKELFLNLMESASYVIY